MWVLKTCVKVCWVSKYLLKGNHNLCERILTSGVGLGDVPLECLFYMTFRFSLLEKQNGNNEVHLFLRVDLMYYSLLSILGISDAILLSLHRFTLSACRSISSGKLAVPTHSHTNVSWSQDLKTKDRQTTVTTTKVRQPWRAQKQKQLRRGLWCSLIPSARLLQNPRPYYLIKTHTVNHRHTHRCTNTNTVS